MGKSGPRISIPILVPLVVLSFALGIVADRILFKKESLPEGPVLQGSATNRPTIAGADGRLQAPGRETDLQGNSTHRSTDTSQFVRPPEKPLAPAREEKSPDPKSAEQKRENARKIFDTYVQAAGKTADSDDFKKVLKLVSELDPDSAPYFIDQYFANAGKQSTSEEREIALELALTCGGPETTKFIKTLLNDPRTPVEDRANLLEELSGLSSSGISMRQIPVDQELAQAAFSLLRSANPEDRSGAMGILGGVNTPEAQAAVYQVIANDPDSRTQAAAIRALGRIGDASAADLLIGFSQTRIREAGKSASVLTSALEAAMKDLQKRFPK
jgi:hypothetical protein